MKYFIDSAKIDEIKYAREHWRIDGVTSNPKHVLTAGKPFKLILEEFAKEFSNIDFPISVEINPHLETASSMMDAAKQFSAYSPNFVIKIPCTEQGLVAAKALVEDGLKVNLTLVFTPSQAMQAGRIRCAYVSPFIGWQESTGIDCADFISKIVDIYQNYCFETEIIVAAVRTGKQIVDAALAGADIVTAGFDVYKDSFIHPFTDKGLQIFKDAWDKTDLTGL